MAKRTQDSTEFISYYKGGTCPYKISQNLQDVTGYFVVISYFVVYSLFCGL